MRILTASPYLPWPLNSGGNAAQFATLKCLAEDHQFTLVCLNEAGMANAMELQAQLPKVKVRAVTLKDSSRAGMGNFAGRVGRRLWRGLRRLHSKPTSDAREILYNPFTPLPRELLVALQEELAQGQDICQIESAELLPLAAWLPDSVTKIFIHYQVHFRYAGHFLKVHGHDPYSDYLAAWMRIQELACLQKYDAVIVFNTQEQQELERLSGVPCVFTSPYPYPGGGLPDHGHIGEFQNKFTFVGSGNHDPNRDALKWLRREIWPLIRRKIPDAQLLVVGEWAKPVQKATSGSGVVFTGFVEDLGAALRGSITLVPVRIGGGIRTKILAALALGIPMVSTSAGADGLLVKDGVELLIRDGVKEFAEAAIQLSCEPKLRENLAKAGLAAVRKIYSPEQVRARRNEIYQKTAFKKLHQTQVNELEIECR
jgi:glycosyltransferase involved in cell wall biosynthesis